MTVASGSTFITSGRLNTAGYADGGTVRNMGRHVGRTRVLIETVVNCWGILTCIVVIEILINTGDRLDCQLGIMTIFWARIGFIRRTRTTFWARRQSCRETMIISWAIFRHWNLVPLCDNAILDNVRGISTSSRAMETVM